MRARHATRRRDPLLSLMKWCFVLGVLAPLGFVAIVYALLLALAWR